jgi:hypothetical protein
MSVTPLPAWSAYVILVAIGACSIGLVALGRAVKAKAGAARRWHQMKG